MMGRTHRKRNIAGWRRFQKAMRTDTARKARKWRRREASEDQAALDALRSQQHEEAQQ
jgi:hypothetical protein